jgi:protein-S-isoprenylcysteine O-methyltransferase Ste14
LKGSGARMHRQEMQPAGAVPARMAGAGLSGGIFRLRDARGYDLAVRAFVSAWFLLLGILAVRSAISDQGATAAPGGWPRFASEAGLALYYGTLWLLVLVRSPPVGRATGAAPGFVALLGSYMPWLVVLFPRAPLSDAGYLFATALVLAGNIVVLVALCYLGRSFSLVPQARRLVVAGPYAVVRHPLYAAEELMFLGTAMLHGSLGAFLLVALHAAIQVGRTLFEERVLARAFPAYAAYQRRTWRLVPFVW